MAVKLAGIKPERVWHFFEEICNIPHPSKKEEKIAAWIIDWAKSKGFGVKLDEIGNIAISKPATKGMEDRKGVAIQGHIDMVCEKNRDVEFDFDTQGIECYIDGDWVKAKGTTLGADNGIGVAMGLAVLDSDDIPHPALEVLCTLDEETGLTGANKLGKDLLTSSDILINIDSEIEGTFTIGCAGGINTAGTYKFETMPVPADHSTCTLVIKGFKGGHSGIEINDGRANAAKLLARTLNMMSKTIDFKLASFNSGNKHNAIPREGFAEIAVPNAQKAEFEKFVKEFGEIIKSEWQSKEPNCQLLVEDAKFDKVMKPECQKRIIKSFVLMPHGPYRMSPDIKGLVQTSTNFAIIETRENEIYVLTSQRSSVETEKRAMTEMVASAIEVGGGVVTYNDGYPAWQPNVNSPILQVASKVWEEQAGSAPHIEIIHAGLECGLIGEKYPHMDMLSIGPNLHDVHTPDERCQISSVERVYNFLLELLKNIPTK